MSRFIGGTKVSQALYFGRLKEQECLAEEKRWLALKDVERKPSEDYTEKEALKELACHLIQQAVPSLLNERELAVLDLTLGGITRADISNQLRVTPERIRQMRIRIKEKILHSSFGWQLQGLLDEFND